MSAGFCLHCGMKLDGTGDFDVVHRHCESAYVDELNAAAKRPKTSMQQQLDRIEGLLMAIRDRYSL